MWIAAVLSVLVLTGASASAQAPGISERCRNLGRTFSDAPTKLTDTDLADLRTCVTEELRRRVAGGIQTPAPPGSPTPAPPVVVNPQVPRPAPAPRPAPPIIPK